MHWLLLIHVTFAPEAVEAEAQFEAHSLPVKSW